MKAFELEYAKKKSQVDRSYLGRWGCVCFFMSPALLLYLPPHTAFDFRPAIAASLMTNVAGLFCGFLGVSRNWTAHKSDPIAVVLNGFWLLMTVWMLMLSQYV